LWRTVYIAKLPAWSRRLQVAFDWAWLALFPRDLSHVRPRVTERVSHAHYAKGDFVFERGDRAQAFYVIEQGEVEVIRPTALHPEGEIVAVLGPDAFFGEQALVTDRPRAASVRARTDAEVLVMGRDVFTQVSTHLAPLRDAFARALTRRSQDPWAERSDLAGVLATLPLATVMDPVPQPLLAPTACLRDAVSAFAQTAAEAVVVSSDGVHAEGVLTMRELLGAVGAGATPATQIRGMMGRASRVVTEADTLTTVARMMHDEGVDLIPVVHDATARQLVGCVRLRRLVEVALARLER